MKRIVSINGSPVYWCSMAGQFRTLLDRIHGSLLETSVKREDLCFIFQEAGPPSAMQEAGNCTMDTSCRLSGPHYQGIATNGREAERLGMNL